MHNTEGSGSGQSAEREPVPPSERTTVDFDQPDSLVGRCLDGRFLIVKNLTDSGADAGGIGVVYLATDIKLMGKEVVVKILQESALKYADIVRKFQHEKEALIRLDHPGIVRILDSGVLTDGNPFMVMDFIKGYSLRKAIKSYGQIPLDLAAHFVESITDAVGAAHSEKILHRDIKPENIMLTPQDEGFDRVRLIDFGIARVDDSKLAPKTEVGRPIGTIMYIAPEQLIGSLELTPAADIYATAIVIYEMLTGELPFKPKTIAEMYQLEREGVRTPPSELRPDMPRVAESILLSALEFDAGKRPQNARSFGRYLAAELRLDPAKATDGFYASVRTEYSKAVTEVIPPTDLNNVVTLTAIQPVIAPKESRRWVKLAAPLAIIIGLLSLAAGYMAWNAAKPKIGDMPPVANTAPTPDLGSIRQFSFFLMVKKIRPDGKYEAPSKFTGEGSFVSGDKYTMNFQSETDGYFYIFNEGKDLNGRTQYQILYPTDKNMDAHISPGEPAQTLENTFGGSSGTEITWLIWTKSKRDEMNAVLKSVNKRNEGVIEKPGSSILANFLAGNKDDPRLSLARDDNYHLLMLKSYGDIMVHRLPLEHK